LEDEETDIALQHANLVAQQANVSVEDATASLTSNNGDIVNAIMELSD
jgi:NACalpha-BTF3-like transcription factor